MTEKERVDAALVSRGLFPSREKAQAAIMAGQVYIGERKVLKASETVKPEDALYTTYQLTSLPAGGVQVSDAYLSNPEELTQYTMQYTSSAIQPPSNGLYERWVSDSCLYLPGQTRSGVLAWWEAQGESTDLRDYLLYGGETAMSAQENDAG